MYISKTLHAGNREEWRQWLARNHNKQTEIWLVFFKKRKGIAQIAYGEAVEEALCFGWIDSNIQKIDEEKFGRKFTPRKGGKWSALNKRRAAAMVCEGKMTEAGFATLTFRDTGDDYGRTGGITKQDLTVPAFLKKLLKQDRIVWDNFQRLAPSYRRNYIGWITAAKTDETRNKRVREALALLARNEKLGMK